VEAPWKPRIAQRVLAPASPPSPTGKIIRRLKLGHHETDDEVIEKGLTRSARFPCSHAL
jgi:hypothetical protein